MSPINIGFTRLSVWSLAAMCLLFCMQTSSFALGWSDDFNDGSVTDGSPFTWTQNVPDNLFPGTYDASSGDYFLKPDYATSPTQFCFTWNNNVSFTDVYMRTQGKVLPGELGPNGNMAIIGHWNAATISTYILYFDLSNNLGFYGLDGGAPVFDESVEILDFDASMETILELDIVGNELRGYAWQPGQPKPAEPQVVYDPVAAGTLDIPSGPSGLGFGPDDNHDTSVVYRYMIAQDTPIIDGVPGDYNNDGKVDAADYVLWRNGGPLANEVDTPGTVNAADYDAWRARFGNSAGSGSSAGLSAGAVPEPVAATLALVGVFSSLLVGNRRPSRAITT